MNISIASYSVEAHRIIRQLLSPWQVKYTSLDDADISIVYDEEPPENVKSVIIPSDSKLLTRQLSDTDIDVCRKCNPKVFVVTSNQTKLSITPDTYYLFNGSSEARGLGNKCDDIVLLAFNIVREYLHIINSILEPKASTTYRFLTMLPFPYTKAPRRLRNFLMRRKKDVPLDFTDILPLDALRYFLVQSIEEITAEKLKKKLWNGKRFVYAITHDIDSGDGLYKAKTLKRLELKYDVQSTWYIPTNHYKLNIEKVRMLSNHGEIGAHGTRHDGKLVSLHRRKIIERVSQTKTILEKIIDKSVEGFRAPLLQCNAELLRALSEVGYSYDSSVPTWEPNHPYTMKSHGVGTLYPLEINGVFEVPLTLPQDHQMLHVLGISPKNIVTTWLRLKEEISNMGGICSILVHPDYELSKSDNLKMYEDFLNNMVADNDAWVTTPSQLTNA